MEYGDILGDMNVLTSGNHFSSQYHDFHYTSVKIQAEKNMFYDLAKKKTRYCPFIFSVFEIVMTAW